jgi:hypothetical protein
MKTLFVSHKITYTGEQLSALWAYMNFGIQGDSLVAFCGPCDIPLSKMVDAADVRQGARIASRLMLHFIEEHFDLNLEKAVLRQRLLASIVRDVLLKWRPKVKVRRDGDDLYEGKRKLSISIATLSPVSTLIHFGINIISAGAPVAAKGLGDYRVAPRPFAQEVMKRYAAEMDSVQAAATKVRGVT